MKKFILTLCLTLCCLLGYSQHHFHHSTYHPVRPVHIVHRPQHHSTSPGPQKHVSPKPPMHHNGHPGGEVRPPHRPTPRPYPVYRQPMLPIQLVTGGIMWYVITHPQHERDTYMYDGHEYKLCPVCQKILIPLNFRTCRACHNY